MERLDKFLANNGIGSRHDVRILIKKGFVTVNNEICKSDDFKIDIDNDIVLVNDKQVIDEPFVYLMLNKPQDYISATFDKNDKVVLDLIGEYKHLELFPVGRLDKDTEGLLLITNDGELAHNLLNPKKLVPKLYYTETEFPIIEDTVNIFRQGISFKDYVTLPAILDILDTNKANVTIFEGKFHQVKNMFLHCKNQVVYLKRIAFKNLILDDNLKLGEYRKLTQGELEVLKRTSEQ